MITLVLNNGSTSARFQLIDTDSNLVLAEGGAELINTSSSYFKYENFRGEKIKIKLEINDYNKAFEIMNDYLFNKEHGVLNSVKEIDAIGHRVVHGGEKYSEAAIVNNIVLDDILRFAKFAPLHNTNSYKSIINCLKIYKGIENVAVFDTAFHQTIPEHNFLYAIPNDLYQDHGVRKYGFHGTSYSYVLKRYAEMLKKDKDSVNSVICHMGGGCSMCSIKDGKSYDTTMGFTPVSGLIMASRSGSIDPSIIPYIMEQKNLNYAEVIKLLNEQSGYLAIANEKDAKAIVERSQEGDISATLLRKMINKDFKYNLLAMMSNLDNIDSIILTGGMSVKNKEQREMFMSNLENFGIILEKKVNNETFDKEQLLSTKNSNIPIYLIPTNEEKEIAEQCEKVLTRGNK